ncbi:MAG: DUF2961 domain-containing protein [Armatimonadetes bacterium]|nr:DUF2961 domain-containing protein [Armatimonadota bacterium]
MRGFVLALMGTVAAAAGAAPVTLSSLLAEMTDRSAVATVPGSAWSLKQASSHDPRKNDPFNAETWHTNQDYGNFIHTELNEGRREWVIMDADGPGVITRWWIPLLAEKDAQQVRFYFDGEPAPRFVAKLNDLLCGQGFVKPPFAFRGWNETDLANQLAPGYKAARGVSGDLYLPIPFARHLKITLDQAPFYYVINYRAYVAGTTVESLSPAVLEAAKPALDKAAAALLAPEPAIDDDTKWSGLSQDRPLTVDLPAGPKAVTEVRIHVDPKAAPQALRSLVLTARFDGEDTVWCPLGEFFGCGPRLRSVRDWWRAVTVDGTLTARWVMPYAKSGSIALVNVGAEPVMASLGVGTGPWTWDERSMLFHATWRRQEPIKTRPMSDWNYLATTGAGTYVGDTLSVFSPAREWYGEGDERIYYDGATYPQHIGTGTEDYYGYAWGMSNFFSSPWLSMPERDILNQGDWRGYTTTSRLRLLDGIAYARDLRVDMEIWNWADTQVDYAVGSFWYARPGATHNRVPQPAEAIAAVRDAPGSLKRPGAVELETLKPVAASRDLKVETQNAGLTEGEWSGGQQLFVLASRAGDFVELALPVPDNAPRAVSLWLTKSRDYGILRFTVNGQKAGDDYDAYDPKAVLAGPVALGTFTPKDGVLTLRAEVVGTNPASTGPKFYFGLDCAVLAKP